MRYLFAVLMLAVFLQAAPAVEAHYTSGCQKSKCKKHVIKPHVGTFVSIGACESGNSNTAHNPGGQYHGRYQFDLGSWKGAGGYGDPHQFGYLEQTYRAVVWLHRNGRQSWPNC